MSTHTGGVGESAEGETVRMAFVLVSEDKVRSSAKTLAMYLEI